MTTAPGTRPHRSLRTFAALRALLAACALATLGAAPDARADGAAPALPADGGPAEETRTERDEPVVRLARPTAVRGTASVTFAELWSGPADAYLGVTVARQLASSTALELTVGGGGPGGDANGVHLGGGLRFTLAGGARSAFTMGLGGHAAFLHRYGTVGIGRLDLAWELRTWSGFDLVLGGGGAVVLSDSRQFEAPESCWLFCDDVGYRAGSLRPHFVLQLGTAF